MCGIFGAVRTAGAFDATDWRRFEAQTDLVAYRGPDDRAAQALAVAEGAEATPQRFDTYLGHRRLAIIDLSAAGRQPMTDGAGRWIVFNGEIFNYIELRDELRALGETLRTDTDTEVILRVYARWGTDGFARFNGMWAFALVDLPARRVVLSRDRFAIKPLYWVQVGPTIAFGSEIKQLLPLMPAARANVPILATYLRQALADHTPETFFEGVHQVPAKHNLEIQLPGGTTRVAPYWSYGRVEVPADPDAAVAAFRDLFLDSVRLRLRSDVPVGALVSGGLDSSSIAAATNWLLGADLRMYSVVPDDPRYSEEPYIDELVRAGIDSHKLRFDAAAAIERLDTTVWHNDEPFPGLPTVAHYAMLERIRAEREVTVILSGQGGDECLLGYHKFFFFHVQHLLRQGRVLAALAALWTSWRRGTVVRQFRLGEARRYLPLKRWRETTPYVRTTVQSEVLSGGTDAARRQRLDLDRFSVPVLNHYEDRNSMAHGLEVRTPFLDHRLVDYALALPTALKIRDGWTKYVLRAAMVELPPAIRWRPDKQGFLTPEEAWLRGALRPHIEAIGRQSALGDMGVIDPARFLARYREFAAGRPGIWYVDISRVLIAERWARRFGVSAG